MDSLSLGGYLGGFLIGGILLPICTSFIADGIVMFFRGRGPFRFLVTSGLALAFVGLFLMASSNALQDGQYPALMSSLGLILWFSIPAAAIGFGVRMLALFLNPSTKAMDAAAIAARKAKADARGARHSATARVSHA